ncbi:MAG TPA: hypothetical protein DEF59_00385 [Candidatus Magasanikbacteria bacterium]|nr:hypothetical protein [Candidatus Magasanikbacteria bacterium]
MRHDIQKMIIDFDDTLFHAYRFKRMLCESANRFGFSKEEFWSTYKQTRDSRHGMLSYTFARHAENLYALHSDFATAQELENAFKNVLENENFVFDDAPAFLNFLKNQGKTLILLSLGDPVFQNNKVVKSGLAHFFDHIEFVDTNKLNVIPDLVDEREPVYFLNDKVLETKEIFEHYPHWFPLVRERADYSLNDYEESGMPSFKNLAAVQDYLIQHH